jgi:hypothetical protein
MKQEINPGAVECQKKGWAVFLISNQSFTIISE